MLRRALKRGQDKVEKGPNEKVKTATLDNSGSHPLGAKKAKDRAEEVLEKVVLGDDEEIVEHLKKNTPAKVLSHFIDGQWICLVMSGAVVVWFAVKCLE